MTHDIRFSVGLFTSRGGTSIKNGNFARSRHEKEPQVPMSWAVVSEYKILTACRRSEPAHAASSQRPVEYDQWHQERMPKS